jgi:signal transduction histidine kinase/ActR/RegA family two-component response regulator
MIEAGPIGDLDDEDARPPSGLWLRLLPPLLAAIVVGCAGAAFWVVLVSNQNQYTERAYTAWHAGEAVAAYDRLSQALAADSALDGPVADAPAANGPEAANATDANPPSDADATTGSGRAGVSLAAFNQAVARLREPDHAAAIATNPAIKALVRRLIAEQNQFALLSRQLNRAAAAGPPETTVSAAPLATPSAAPGADALAAPSAAPGADALAASSAAPGAGALAAPSAAPRTATLAAPLAAPLAATLADDTVELARLNEAVNQEGAVRAEQQKDAADRRRALTAALVVALAAAGLLMIGLLVERSREFQISSRALRQTGERLRRALETAGRAEITSARFIAAVGQDLRAPMDTVMSLADSLLEQPLTPAQGDLAGRIRLAGGELARALDDAIDYASLRADALTLRDQAFSPEAVTAAAVAGVEARARAKGLTIVAIPAPGLPRMLLGDSDRVGRVLARLLANAVRLTERGGVSLQVLCKDRNAISAVLEWVVTDSGAGMDPARIDLLFGADPEAVSRLDDDDATDLGLALCRRLVSRMGGGMTVEQAAGEGTRFRVRLPLRIAPAGRSVAKLATAPSAAHLRDRLQAMGRRPRLLMAEDMPAGQFILRQLLAREGIVPDVVGDGRAAVRAAERNRYDVICLDLRMPDMDGLEAARRIRSGRGPSATAPIIAVTAHNTAADIQACQSAGMTMFIEKPVRRETLLNAILASLSGPEEAAGQASVPIPADLASGVGHAAD